MVSGWLYNGRGAACIFGPMPIVFGMFVAGMLSIVILESMKVRYDDQSYTQSLPIQSQTPVESYARSTITKTTPSIICKMSEFSARIVFE